MTAHTPHPDPDPTTPGGAASAAPCLRCEREDGAIAGTRDTPDRTWGYCRSCYSYLWLLCKRHGYLSVHTADRAHPRGTRPPVLTELAHTDAQRRAWARQRALRDRRGPLIARAAPTGRDPEDLIAPSWFDDFGNWGGPCDPPWRPAPWFTALAA